MTIDSAAIGTVASDADTPTFELVRIKLKAGKDVRPNTLVRIPVARNDPVILIGRIRSAYEHNPNEAVEAQRSSGWLRRNLLKSNTKKRE
jgi:hypothetical protein